MDFVTYTLCKKYVDVEIKKKITSTYIMGGSIPFSELPEPDSSSLNHIYIITDDFTTNDKFLCGAGINYLKGTQVAVIDAKGVLMYDIFSTGSSPIEAQGAVTVETRFDLPTIGKEGGVYFVKNEGSTYRWDQDKGSYECVGRDYFNVTIINGNAS